MTTPAQEAEFWNGCAEDPDLSRKWLCGEPELTRETMEYIRTWLPDAGWVADLGCGEGRLMHELWIHQFKGIIVGVDVAADILFHASYNGPHRNCPPVAWLEGDGRSLPDSLHDLDGAYSVAMIQHIPAEAVESYYRSLFGALRSGARFVAQYVPGYDHDDFRHEYEPEWMFKMAESVGFEAIGVMYAVQERWQWLVVEKP